MPILHLIDTLSLGGAQTILKSVLEYDNNSEMHVYALREKLPEIDIQHTKKYIYPSTAKYSFKPLKHLSQYIEKNNIKILHCHLFRSEVTGYFIKKNYHPNIKLIFHEHGQIVGSDTNRKYEDWMYNTFKKRSHSTSDKILAVSDAMRNLLIEKGNTPETKIETLYNFVDLQKFDSNKLDNVNSNYKSEIGLENNFVVGFAGRIIPRKGWRSFVEMATIINKTHPNIKFLMAGTGADVEPLQQLIKEKKLENTIHYLGFVKDMISFYSSLDCFVMPSWFEGLPMSQLEVMALGVPLLTTTGPGMDEIPKNGVDAVYLKMKNPKDQAEKVIDLFRNPEKAKKLSENAKNTVQQHSLENYMKQLNNVYTKILMN